MLWKMEYLVEGKNLEQALTSVIGIALEFKGPTPVTNGTVKKGVVKQTHSGSTNAERLISYLTSEHLVKKGDFTTSSVIQRAMSDLQIPKNSYSFMITNLKKQNFLTTTERKGTLKVL